MAQTEISLLGFECQKQFTALLRAVGESLQNELSVPDLDDELGRFRAWANNIGAMSSGKASLDYRVRKAAYLRDHVKSLLQDLNASLKYGITAIFNRFNMTATSITQDVDDAVSFSASDVASATESESSDSEANVEPESQSTSPEVTLHPLRTCYYEIVNIIDKLFDVSILIRGTARTFEANRAAAHIEKDKAGNDVLPQFKEFISFKLGKPGQPLPEWLIDRLTNVIAMRRQQFYYQKAHADRLGQPLPTFQEVSPIPTTSTAPPRSPQSSTISKSTKKTASVTMRDAPDIPKVTKTGFSNVTSLTTASDWVPEHKRPKPTSSAKPTRTEIMVGSNTKQFPRLPKGDKEFVCYQCFIALPADFRLKDSWRLFPLASPL
jgi:hypothetical protein